MYLGQIVELADSLELCDKPLHPYTQALFTAALPAHPDEKREKLTITGEVPSALDAALRLPLPPALPAGDAALRASKRRSARKSPPATAWPATSTDSPEPSSPDGVVRADGVVREQGAKSLPANSSFESQS